MNISPQYRTLGAFTGKPDAITALQAAHLEELKAAYQRIAELEASLHECREYIEQEIDVEDGSDGPVPNRAMRLVVMIDETLHGPAGF